MVLHCIRSGFLLAILLAAVCADALCKGDAGNPSGGARLYCRMTAPEIKADRVQFKYYPMPFNAEISIYNYGDAADSVFAKIIVQRDLRLYGPDAPDKDTKRPQPEYLFPGQSGMVGWTLWHPMTFSDSRYVLTALVWTGRGDTVRCSATVLIPGFSCPILSSLLQVPPVLAFDYSINAYKPNPFTVTVSCCNKGSGTAYDVAATILLPDGVALEDSISTPALMRFNPSTMGEYRGGQMPSVTWKLRYTGLPEADATPEFTVRITGLDTDGRPLDTVTSAASMKVQGVPVNFRILCPSYPDYIPKSLTYNRRYDRLEPNPFRITWRVVNKGIQPVKVSKIQLIQPKDNDVVLLSRDPATFPDTTIAPYDTMYFPFDFRAMVKPGNRRAYFTFVLYDKEGNPAACGPHVVDIDVPENPKGSPASLSCSATNPVQRIVYDIFEGRYHDKSWAVDVALFNNGGAQLNNVYTRLELSDSSMIEYVEYDPSADSSNFRSYSILARGETRNPQWRFRLRRENTTGLTITIPYNIRYGSDETPAWRIGPTVRVNVDPVMRIAEAGLTADGPGFALANHPNPFSSSTMIAFSLPSSGHCRIALFDALGREARILAYQWLDAGRHTVEFNAAGLPPGVYLCRLEAGMKTMTRKMIIN
jgi:hypothetical protein